MSTAGRMLIDGHDLRDVSLKSLREQIGKVTQETMLFNDTVRNNIAYGQPDVPHAQGGGGGAGGAGARIYPEMPEGYDTMIGEKGFRLSGGERQRLAIARAILKNAPVLILDEATSALDTESESLVQAALQQPDGRPNGGRDRASAVHGAARDAHRGAGETGAITADRAA